MLAIQSVARFPTRAASAAHGLHWAIHPKFRRPPPIPRRKPPSRLGAFHTADVEGGLPEKPPPACTADELHFVSLRNSDWRLALWRYAPSPQAPPRNHPLLLLSGVGTNAIGYDLAPESSFARHMSGNGFDTWILEVRGAGLSTQEIRSLEVNNPANAASKQIDSVIKSPSTNDSTMAVNLKASSLNGKKSEIVDKSNESDMVKKLTEAFMSVSERLLGFRSIAEHFYTAGQFQKLGELIERYNWDFDHYLEEDIPAAMEYIKAQCKPRDGKLLAIGHSMGGILLYAMLSRYGYEGRDSELASVVTLASSLDYRSSNSSLKLLLPLANAAEILNVIVLPLGLMLTAAYPLVSRPPYVLSWLGAQISARDMMSVELFERLVLNNFCTIPVKLLLQLKSVFHEGGLRDRSGTFIYKDHLRSSNVPVLAIAGDQDLICPPQAVYETVKFIREDLVTYKLYGEPSGPHYGHYDIVAGHAVGEQVYPCIIEFLSRQDTA